MSVAKDLRVRRAELAAELERLTTPPPPGSSIAFGKRIGEGTAEAVERLSTTAAARSIAGSISDIDRALEKLVDGSYGACDDCNQPIGEARQKALPATARCIDCSRTGSVPGTDDRAGGRPV